jgi:demethylmenaquinone methyltransferase/2-methoxy-6-polyprenyl-1,4-benzoquinol methylase
MPDTIGLFNKVAKHYDALNTFFSLGLDSRWRRRLSKEIRDSELVLDIATGTGKVAIETIKNLKRIKVIGADPSAQMLKLARGKIGSDEISGRIALCQCGAEVLPFRDDTFDAVTIAFGIRNTMDPQKSLSEMRRVLKPGGKACILEFALPQNQLFSLFYLFYFKNFLPLIGSLFGTGNEYKYLSDSTSSFPQRELFVRLMEGSGFNVEKSVELTLGVAIIYIGVK